MGTLSFGLLAQYGRHSTEVENMSEAIGWGSFIYLASALVLFSAAAYLGPKPLQNAAEQQPHVH